jgi:hypothetical protein
MVTGETEEIFYSQGTGSQEVTLERNPIPVPTDHLHHRLHTALSGNEAAGKTTQANNGSLVISNVHRINVIPELQTLFFNDTPFGSLWRSYLRGNGEDSPLEHTL